MTALGAAVTSAPSSAAPPATGWLPAPPPASIYTGHQIGTFTKEVIVGQSSGNHGWQALFYNQRQFCVRTSAGVIFMSYCPLNNNQSPPPTTWILKRSNDGGSTWTTTADSTSGTFGSNNNGGVCPGLEIDANDNVYLVMNQFLDTVDPIIRIAKFSPSDNYATPTIWRFPSFMGSGKWSCVFDQTRNWIWISSWERNAAVQYDLMAVDTTGAVTVQKQILGPWSTTSSTRHADVSYTFLTVLQDGTVCIGWHNEAGSGYKISIPQSYYAPGFVYTPDGGNTFYGPAGAISGTIIGDDTGGARAGYQIQDLSAAGANYTTGEFISGTDPAYFGNGGTKYNNNEMAGFTFNNNALHFYYHDNDGTADIVGPYHRTYARFDWTSKAVNLRQRPFQSTSGTSTIPKPFPGSFIQDTSLASRLYFIFTGDSASGDAGKVIVMKSDDAGGTWTRYAASSVLGGSVGNPIFTGGYRWVLTDGKILGYTVAGLSPPYNVYFFEISPA